MPVCSMCNGKDFSCLDGKFFCVECDTQSQDFVEEQAPELLSGSGLFTTKQLKKRKEKGTSDAGVPWRTVEGFQQIIKGHVNALIALGINPDIDQVMQQIWFKYVQESGMAIISGDKDLAEDSLKDARYRDFFLNQCSGRHDDIKKRKIRFNLKISGRVKSKSRKKLKKQEEWFSLDSDSELEDESTCSESSNGVRSCKNLSSWETVDMMSMMKVICFCYLSLRWMKEPVTIGDLIRWVETGILPYYGGIECFPPHMKLCQFDYQLFVSHVRLEYYKVILMCDLLSKYLEMPPLPQVDIRELSARYLYQLNLPLAFSTYVNTIVMRVDKASWPLLTGHVRTGRKLDRHRAGFVRCKSSEMIAAAIIAIILKFIFVLNDKDEWHIDDSETQCPLHGDSKTTCTNFTWQRWLQQHLLQEAKVKETSYNLFDESIDATEVGDVHSCMEHQLSVIRKGTLHRSDSHQKKLEDHLEARRFVFKCLVDEQGSTEEKLKRTEERTSLRNAYELLGRGDETCSTDFTLSCVSILMKQTQTKGSKYVRYDAIKGTEKLSDFHRSYGFLLTVLGRLTKATWRCVHDYVNVVETLTVEPFRGD